MSEQTESRPNINVTPLIDILLVLLIIFMAISPIKPTRFEAKIPAEQKYPEAEPHSKTLIVTIKSDETLMLNRENNLGTVSDPQKLVSRLSGVFQTRLENGDFAEGLEARNDLTPEQKIQKTVFIKAPKNLHYIEVAKVVDSVKQAGASPIGLQIDDLE